MTFTELINEDLKNAMKAQEREKMETLRMLRSSMIELAKSGKEITKEDELKAIMNQAKKRKDAAEAYTKAGRLDLAEKEKSELAIIETYLPKQLSPEEVKDEIEKIIDELKQSGVEINAEAFKLVMPKAMGILRGRADGNVVQAAVKELLN